ncbi:MAG: hypothetical protein LBT05_02095 [Planctomycetaceae bacterium]|jgi:hypothetical protein|nr:hypothetical protein [Planctomycetaceae bacterium]
MMIQNVQTFLRRIGLAVIAVLFFTGAGFAEENTAEKYLFRYKFCVGDVLKWNVVSQINMLTTKSGEREFTETYSGSTKVWKVLEVDENGTAILEYSISDVDMKNKTSLGAEEKTYNSKTDDKPAPEFHDVAEAIGKPLAHFTINTRGELLKKVRKFKYADSAEENRITIPTPENPIALGESWDYPKEIMLPQKDGTVKKIAIRERYTLKSVKNQIATFDFKTIVLTPLTDDRESQMQILAKIKNGTIQFDMKNGCSIRQQLDVDRSVVNPPQMRQGSVTYKSRFIEKYLREEN